MRVVFTDGARRAAADLDAWWRENRDHIDVFAQELDAAVSELGTGASSIAVYAATRRGLVRRLLLPKTNNHVYFVIDATAGVVRVVALWGASRRGGPRLR
jgi:hypothetical protein